MNVQILVLFGVAILIWIFERWLYDVKRKQRVITTGTYISNQTNGNERDTLYSNVIIGNVYIVVLVLHRFIIKDMQKET